MHVNHRSKLTNFSKLDDLCVYARIFFVLPINLDRAHVRVTGSEEEKEREREGEGLEEDRNKDKRRVAKMVNARVRCAVCHRKIDLTEYLCATGGFLFQV